MFKKFLIVVYYSLSRGGIDSYEYFSNVRVYIEYSLFLFNVLISVDDFVWMYGEQATVKR